MTKVLKGGDVVPGCDFEMKGSSEEEVLQRAAEHAKTDHGMDNVPPEILAKVRGAIHDEGESRAKGAGANEFNRQQGAALGGPSFLPIEPSFRANAAPRKPR